MKLQLFSDVHLEFDRKFEPDITADVVILAGDIHIGTQGLEWAAEYFAGKAEVVYVAGNHEFYHHCLPGLIDELRDSANRFAHVHFLEQGVKEIGGVRFLGATLWTDFKLNGSPEQDLLVARQAMSDYRHILGSAGRPIQPSDTISSHQETREWLNNALSHGEAKRTVVVTHHAPSACSLISGNSAKPMHAAYASDLSELILTHQPRFWLHGHIHRANQYSVGDTVVVANPLGYPKQSTGFQADLVLEL